MQHNNMGKHNRDEEGWARIDQPSMEDLLEALLNGGDGIDIPIDAMTELEAPMNIDLDEINESSQETATRLTERLSGYYFDEEYIQQHPYIPIKIETEMNNIRRLMKILSINEAAQDVLLKSICKTPNKGNLFMSMNSMQKTMVEVQASLNKLIDELENIFKEMQSECEKTWKEKEKEVQLDGTMTVRGSRDFIKELQQKLWNKKLLEEQQTEQELVQEEIG